MNTYTYTEVGGAMSDSGAGAASAKRVYARDLPRHLHDYLRNPAQTARQISLWLNACWQLRHCDQVGPWTRVTGRVFIRNSGQIIFGERVQVYAHYARSVFATFPGGRLEIGDRTTLNYGLDIAATRLVKIGDDCRVGTHVIILDNDFHEVAHRERTPEGQPVVIGNNVWIGNRAMILPGVTIGDGAIIGAGSVVLTDVPPRTLVLGNPARAMRQVS